MKTGRLLFVGIATLAASSSVAETRVVAAVSVTKTVNGEGRVDLVFINQGSVSLGLSPRSLKLTPDASASCRSEIARLETGPSRTSISLEGEMYATITPPGGWAHRQLQVPASLMEVGCTLRLVVAASAGAADAQEVKPDLIFPLRAGYSTSLDLPVARGRAPAATAYSEYNGAQKNHVVHVLYNFNGDAKGNQEVVANANTRCAKGTLVTLTLPHSDLKLQDRRVLVSPGQWSGLALWAKGALIADGCSVTTKLVGRSSEGNSRTAAAEVTVKQPLDREREFSPDLPVP